jgi:hypothetical protein
MLNIMHFRCCFNILYFFMFEFFQQPVYLLKRRHDEQLLMNCSLAAFPLLTLEFGRRALAILGLLVRRQWHVPSLFQAHRRHILCRTEPRAKPRAKFEGKAVFIFFSTEAACLEIMLQIVCLQGTPNTPPLAKDMIF